ncbi:MAG: hypothetical protein RL329_1348 [Bacteroidota bacterium]|jgi:hypothetical protein
MLKNIVILLFSLWTTLSMAQVDGSIQGRVLEGNTPIEFVNILLFSKKDSIKIVQSAITDSIGFFQLKNLLLGHYQIKMQLIGYQLNTIDIDLTNQLPNLDLGKISLQTDAKIFKTVEIAARKSIVQRTFGTSFKEKLMENKFSND